MTRQKFDLNSFIPVLFSLLLCLLVSACCSSLPSSPCKQSTTSDKLVPKPTKPVLEIRGGSYLEGLHPELIKRARILYEQAEQEGISIRFISGYRRYRPKKNIKNNGSLASWHNFGAAFDLNLVKRKSMREALKHLSEDQADWAKIGEFAKALDLTWGKPWGDEEIFHFEWHPGHPDALRKKAFQRLINVTGAQVRDYQESWKLFQNK